MEQVKFKKVGNEYLDLIDGQDAFGACVGVKFTDKNSFKRRLMVVKEELDHETETVIVTCLMEISLDNGISYQADSKLSAQGKSGYLQKIIGRTMYRIGFPNIPILDSEGQPVLDSEGNQTYDVIGRRCNNSDSGAVTESEFFKMMVLYNVYNQSISIATFLYETLSNIANEYL